MFDLVRSGKVMTAVDRSLNMTVRAARVTVDRPLSTTSMADLGDVCVAAPVPHSSSGLVTDVLNAP